MKLGYSERRVLQPFGRFFLACKIMQKGLFALNNPYSVNKVLGNSCNRLKFSCFGQSVSRYNISYLKMSVINIRKTIL